MTRLNLTLALCFLGVACGQTAPESGAPALHASAQAQPAPPDAPRPSSASAQPSGPVLRLKRFDIMDANGFGQPVVALSLLAPADWRLEGGVRWNPGYECPVDLIATQARLTSPDGRFGFEMFPNYMANWSSDQGYNQMLMQAAQMAGSGCAVAPPMQIPQFVEQVFAPAFRQGAQVLDTQPNQQVADELQRKAIQAMPGSHMEIDAARVRIAHGNQEEWVIATIMRDASSAQGMPTSYITITENVLSFRAPRGKLEANENLFSAMLSSIRINPQWQQAVQQVQSSITRAQIAGAAQRSQIIAQTGEAFREMTRDSWRRDSEAFDHSSRRWSEYMRGVQTYSDPDSGTTWELNSGYEHVWKAPNDEFILTNDHNFDPNTAFPQANWNQMQAVQ